MGRIILQTNRREVLRSGKAPSEGGEVKAEENKGKDTEMRAISILFLNTLLLLWGVHGYGARGGEQPHSFAEGEP